MKNVKSDIAGYLRNYLDEINQINLNDEDFLNFRYLDSGHIDSFEIMHLIVNIEQEFNIRIEAEDTESDEFRYIEDDDIFSGFFNGDPLGDDYEVVDYDFITDLYFGRNSGFAYEDEEETFDVNLMQSDKEKMAFFKKASAISLTYNVSIQTSMSLVTLGKKVEKMIGGNGEITNADQQALVTDLSNLTGVTLEDVTAAQGDETKKAELLKKIADKIGATASNLEHKILPEVFGVNLL